MPLLDHFRPPVSDEIQWNTFHAVWAGSLADQLTPLVPNEYRVHEHLKLGGGPEIDVAATRPGDDDKPGGEWRSVWKPDPPLGNAPLVFPDRFEVLVFRQPGGRQLVGAIELISPGNKDEFAAREAFTAKVVSYLHEGVSVILIDVVTERWANMHNLVADRMGLGHDLFLPDDGRLYAAAYRPVTRNGRPGLDVWTASFAVGRPLPTMPLRLIADNFIPVDFEAAYTDARRRRRLN